MHNRFQIRSATRVAFCLALLLTALPPNVAAQTAPITIRLAGDEWFLHALTGTGLIDSYERESGVRVQVIFKNDRTILGELDKASDESNKAADAPFDLIVVRHRFLGALVEKHEVQPIDSFLADRSLHDPAFHPEQQLYANWWKELSSYKGQIYGYPFTALTAYLCYRKDLLADPANRRDFLAQFHRQLRAPRNWKEYSELAQFFNRPRSAFLRDVHSRQAKPGALVRVAEFHLCVRRQCSRCQARLAIRRHRGQLSTKYCGHSAVSEADRVQPSGHAYLRME